MGLQRLWFEWGCPERLRSVLIDRVEPVGPDEADLTGAHAVLAGSRVWDQEAIEWVQDNVLGSPVILEAHLSQYRWGARFANYTGLPTVIGWPWHQIQQRTAYSFAITDRARDVREMYETTDDQRALELLRQYRVKYVVVGDLERINYVGDGLNKFETLGRKVFENRGTAIYEARWN